MGTETQQTRPNRVTRLSHVLCAADPRGSQEAVAALLREAEGLDIQAIALVGDLSGGGGTSAYRSLFKAFGSAGHHTYWVPGPDDAPIEEYLREAHNIEVVHPFLRGVHGAFAFAPGNELVAGFGGEVDDDPEAPRDESRTLRYPRWEVEYRLKVLQHELDDHEQRVLLFSTAPAHKGLGTGGSEALTHMIGTLRARLVVCGGARGTEMIGRTLVVAPGSLAEGHYAVADVHKRTAELAQLSLASH